MKTYLVTGGAGFIGANYLKYILAKHTNIRVVVLDALPYAGYLGTIAKDIDNERGFFVRGQVGRLRPSWLSFKGEAPAAGGCAQHFPQ